MYFQEQGLETITIKDFIIVQWYALYLFWLTVMSKTYPKVWSPS